jgi:hypothetical protein
MPIGVKPASVSDSRFHTGGEPSPFAFCTLRCQFASASASITTVSRGRIFLSAIARLISNLVSSSETPAAVTRFSTSDSRSQSGTYAMTPPPHRPTAFRYDMVDRVRRQIRWPPESHSKSNSADNPQLDSIDGAVILFARCALAWPMGSAALSQAQTTATRPRAQACHPCPTMST